MAKTKTIAPQETKVKEQKTKKEIIPSALLDSFPSITKTEKTNFAKKAARYHMSEEELLRMAVAAVGSGKLKLKKKTVFTLE